MMISRRHFLLKSRILSISHARNQITFTSRIFSNTICELYLKQPLPPPQHTSHARSLPLTAPLTIYQPLKLDNDQLSLLPEILDYATFAPIMQLKNETLYKPIRDKFASLLKNVVLGVLESFFQLDHQVDISLYLMEATALCHSRELVGLKSS